MLIWMSVQDTSAISEQERANSDKKLGKVVVHFKSWRRSTYLSRSLRVIRSALIGYLSHKSIVLRFMFGGNRHLMANICHQLASNNLGNR